MGFIRRRLHMTRMQRRIARSRNRARGTTEMNSVLAADHLLLLLAQAGDAERHNVASFEKFRLRLHAEPDAGRRAGDDDVAGLEDKILRAGPDDVTAVEDHGRGIAALALLAIDVEPHGEILRVLDLVLGNQPRSERAERLAALALGPLAAAFDLKYT